MFVFYNGKNYYLAKSEKKKTVIVRPATPEEIEAYHATRQDGTDFAAITCSNPDCDRAVKILRTQKRELYTKTLLQYGRFNLVYCSQECQEVHLKQLNIVPNNQINKKWSFGKDGSKNNVLMPKSVTIG